VRVQEHRADGGGIVEMSAYRPFGLIHWPTWWRSTMRIRRPGGTDAPSIRFTHVGGITRGMEVEWSFQELDPERTLVRILHVWDGPDIPLVGPAAATLVIGPVFVHGIASRTLAGLAEAAERGAS
jgi:hypothetical protein